MHIGKRIAPRCEKLAPDYRQLMGRYIITARCEKLAADYQELMGKYITARYEKLAVDYQEAIGKRVTVRCCALLYSNVLCGFGAAKKAARGKVIYIQRCANRLPAAERRKLISQSGYNYLLM